MPEDHSSEWEAPPPRQHKSETLQRKAEAIVKLHRITFGNFQGKRVIYADEGLPEKDYKILAEAMKAQVI